MELLCGECCNGAQAALQSELTYLEVFVALYCAALYKIELGSAEQGLAFMQDMLFVLQTATQDASGIDCGQQHLYPEVAPACHAVS